MTPLKIDAVQENKVERFVEIAVAAASRPEARE